MKSNKEYIPNQHLSREGWRRTVCGASLSKLPTYRECRVFIRGQLKGNKPDWFPLVDSVKDFACGVETYVEHLPFVAKIDPKEEVSVNLKMGLGEKVELKYGSFP